MTYILTIQSTDICNRSYHTSRTNEVMCISYVLHRVAYGSCWYIVMVGPQALEYLHSCEPTEGNSNRHVFNELPPTLQYAGMGVRISGIEGAKTKASVSDSE